MILLALLGIFIFNSVFSLLMVGVGDAGFAVWMTFLNVGIYGFVIIVMLIIQTRQVIIEEDGITLSTSFYEARYKKKPVRLSLGYIAKVHPNYFFNRNEKDLKKVGFEFVSIDGQVGTILLVGPSAASKDKVKESLAEAFGSRWKQVYTEKPNIDEERWKKIGHYSKRSFASVSLRFAAAIMIPYFLIMLLILFIPAISFDIFLLLSMGSMAILILGMIYGIKKIRKWVEACTIKARMELLEHMSKKAPVITSFETESKTVFEPDKHLAMTEPEWRKVEKRVAQWRPLAYVMVLSAVIFTVFFIGARVNESIVLFIIALPAFAVLMISILFSQKITQAETLVKKAVDHELKTGELVLPEEFHIPKSWFTYISREPIKLTEKEKALAKRFKDQGEMMLVKQMIFWLTAIFLPMAILFITNPLKGVWYQIYVYLAAMMIPVLFFIIYMISSQRVVVKVNRAEEIDRFIKERKEKESETNS
jgi:hypothetical protein